MTKPTAIIAAILALLTGLVLGQLGFLAVPGPQTMSSASSVSAQDLATARSFYDEMNRFLANGEPGIESMLTLDFVDHTGSLPDGRDAEQFMSGWVAIGAFLPQLQLEVVDLQWNDGLVAVRLDVHPGHAAGIAGISLQATVPESAIEFLRIERGKVAERWGGEDRLPGMNMTLIADFNRTGPSLSGPVIQRVSLPEGQEVALSGNDMAVLHVITGELRLDRAATDPQLVVHPISDPVASGETRIVEFADTLLVSNLTHSTAEFFAFSLYGLFPEEANPADTGTVGALRSIEVTTLAYLPLELTGLSKRLSLSVTQVTLPAGSSMASHTPHVVEEIVVLDGALEASVHSGRALVTLGNGQAQPFDGVETASAGYGFSASSIATLSYRVSSAQPATLLIMTIAPVPSLVGA